LRISLLPNCPRHLAFGRMVVKPPFAAGPYMLVTAN